MEARGPALFRNDVLKAGPTQDRKDRVVEAEEGEVAARIRLDARADAAHAHPGHAGRGGEGAEEGGVAPRTRPAARADAAHDPRDHGGREEEREQEPARAARGGHGGEE